MSSESNPDPQRELNKKPSSRDNRKLTGDFESDAKLDMSDVNSYQSDSGKPLGGKGTAGGSSKQKTIQVVKKGSKGDGNGIRRAVEEIRRLVSSAGVDSESEDDFDDDGDGDGESGERTDSDHAASEGEEVDLPVSGRQGKKVDKQKNSKTGAFATQSSKEDNQDAEAHIADAWSENSEEAPVHIRCEIRIEADGPIGDDYTSWHQPHHKRYPITTTMESFDTSIRRLVARLLKEDRTTLRRARTDDHVLRYAIHFDVACCGESEYRPDEPRHKFETLGDLFEHPSVEGLRLKVRVPVSYDSRPNDVPNQPPYPFNRDKITNIPSADLIVAGRDWKEGTERNKYSHTRLGNVDPALVKSFSREERMSTKASGVKSTKSGSSTESSTSEDKGVIVPMRPMLIGEWFTGQMERAKDLFFIEVRAWDFDDFCIGDVNVCAGLDKFNTKHKYFDPYNKKADSKDNLVQKIRQRLEKNDNKLGDRVPFMPTYTLNNLDSKALGLGYELKDDEVIYGVVRFVDHIRHRNNNEDQPIQGLQPQWLPFDVQFSFDNQDAVDGVIKGITDEMQRYADKSDSKTDNGRTMKKFMKRDDWELQMWVLPQKGRKMYRFPSGHADSWNCLDEYLCEEKVKGGGEFAFALYLEAHIVPKAGTQAKVEGGKGHLKGMGSWGEKNGSMEKRKKGKEKEVRGWGA